MKRKGWRRGLAPEIQPGYLCPWLTRTAGQRIQRPDELALLIRALALGMDTMAQAAKSAQAAILQFGAALVGASE